MPSTDAPPSFHVLAKPTGAICNLRCSYCFYTVKEQLYPGSRFRMTDEVMESYIRQYLGAQRVRQATISWQGGEPTLMGLDFFARAIAYERQYAPPGMSVERTMQTNGTLLNAAWCDFFRDHEYLVGLSLDGPQGVHDAYRLDTMRQPTFDRVMRAAEMLQADDVDFNILCAVHAANAAHPLEVYRFFRDEVGAKFIQFIPIVEPSGKTNLQGEAAVTDRSVTPNQWGRFLIAVFDEWVRNDVGSVFVQHFDAALAAWMRAPPEMCIFSPTCGTALALEHNGDLYSCDHFVQEEHLLGNILDAPLVELVASGAQQRFGLDKRDSLPRLCLECPVRFACHGECPKNRFSYTPSGEPGLNYLCAGYRAFFVHVDSPMRQMALLLQQGRAPAEVMPRHSQAKVPAKVGRNDPCPCGSGLKYKKCHGRQRCI